MEAIRNMLPPVLVALLSAFALAYRETPQPEKAGPPKALAEGDTTDWSGWYWVRGVGISNEPYLGVGQLERLASGGYRVSTTSGPYQSVGIGLVRGGRTLSVGWQVHGEKGCGVVVLERKGTGFAGHWLNEDARTPRPETWTPLHPPKGN